jgi:DNA polymerase (family 10)
MSEEIKHPLGNVEIAAALRELADLQEIRGENPFRIRANRNAIRTIQGLTRPLTAMVEAGEDLTELPGIGKEISGHILELFRRGDLEVVEEIAREIPRELARLVSIEGLGPKKVARLYEELSVVTPDDLEEALEQGRIEALEGFGKKSVENLTRALKDFRKHQERFLLAEVDELVGPLVVYMRGAPGVEEVEVAGSTRRRRDTVGDVDLLVSSDDSGEAVVEHFTAFHGVTHVESAGPTRARVTLRSGLSVDLRVLPSDSYGAALLYFTGSKEHNVALRTLAVREGLKISEYGAFKVSGKKGKGGSEEKRVAGATEEEMYDLLGLAWIPPVLRENRGEIEAAGEDALPELVTLDDIRGDLHMHSTWSDGKRSILEMAEACRERGYSYMAMTDHSKGVTVAGGLDAERVRSQWKEIDKVRKKVKDGFLLLRGLEVDILKDGSLDLPDEELEGLDLVIVSVHSYMDQDRKVMTERVIRALEHPEVDILAHPTGRLLNRREAFEIEMEDVLAAAAENQVAVEINANPLRLDLNEFHARRAAELGVMVVVNTDAHSFSDLEYMSYGVAQAQRAWLQPSNVLNTRGIRDLKSWLKRKD